MAQNLWHSKVTRPDLCCTACFLEKQAPCLRVQLVTLVLTNHNKKGAAASNGCLEIPSVLEVMHSNSLRVHRMRTRLRSYCA